MRNRFQLLLDILLTASAVTIAVVVAARFVREEATSTKRVAPAKVGEQLAPLTGIDFEKSGNSLLMVLRSDCRFCTESIPLYRELLTARAADSPQLIAASTDEPSRFAEYLRAHDLQFDATVHVGRHSLANVPTPTLIHVDRHGSVLHTWVGRLSDAEAKAVMQVVCPACVEHQVQGGD